MELTVLRDEESQEVTTRAAQCSTDGAYKLGAWIRDSMAGIGTLTFVEMCIRDRAKELLILVGDDQVVARMAANDRQQRRYSGLRARLARGGPEKEENHGPAPISSEPALPTQVSLL